MLLGNNIKYLRERTRNIAASKTLEIDAPMFSKIDFLSAGKSYYNGIS